MRVNLTAIFPYTKLNGKLDRVIGKIEKQEYYSIKEYYIIGSEISRGTISNNEKVNIQNLTNGLYFLKFESGNTIKFIK